MVKLNQLDAFPKVDDAFVARSTSGAYTSMAVLAVLAILAISETARYLDVHHMYEFVVDSEIRQSVEIGVDLTVAMKCQYVTMDVFDSSGTALHVGNTVGRTPTTFSAAGLYIPQLNGSPLRVPANAATGTLVPDPESNACRMRGTFVTNKVAGNVHVTALGHAYAGIHVPHEQVNFTHRIDRLSFGDDVPSSKVEMSNPLNGGYEWTDKHFVMYQYFVNVVPSRYLSTWSTISTNQYAVTDHKQVIATNPDGSMVGIPGIFFRYNFEPIAIQITEGSGESFPRFLVRMAGILGGVYVCAGHIHGLARAAAAFLNDRRKRTVRI
ncbi:endoplasmic reticulum vesicle transporter-domain-containing protein [Blastocladiella britannica]|nr:endoplasmic reticulum vesicle transporter-domain-containing protein [Blastocladiella britannica]